LKRLIIIFLVIFHLSPVKGQKEKVPNYTYIDERAIHFGFCLGINQMDFITRNSYPNYLKDSLVADVSKPSLGFHVQIVSNYRLGRYFDLRFLPGVSFGQRTVDFYKKNVLVNSNQKLESNFLEFPLLIKYKAKRLNNFRPYIISGANFRADLAKQYTGNNESDESKAVYLDLKVFDIYYEAGGGIDFYLPYFKLSTELKFSYGFKNMINRRSTDTPQYENAIEKLNSTLVMLSFLFE
jgi:hypothetical protein